MNTLLEVHELSRTFGGLTALQDVSLSVRGSECVGIIGPNGAGKTTLFNAISGFDRRRGDRIRFDGAEVGRLTPAGRAKRGLVRTFQGARTFQTLSVHKHLWLAENIIADVETVHGRRGLAAGLEFASAVGLSQRRHALAADLPYGLMKCLGIVMALSAGARMLLLDEPAAGLSEEEGETIAEAIHHARRADVAVVVIDHHLDFLKNVCDRLIGLNFGVKIAEGLPEEVLSNEIVREAYLG